MPIDATLLKILACPNDKGPLVYVADELFYNPRLRLAYPIVDGLPVLLISEAREVDDEEHAAILARATS